MGRGRKRTTGTFFTHPPLPSREVACRHYFPGNYKKNHIRHIEITVHVSYNKVTSASWPKLAPIPHWMWIQFHDFLLTCDAPGRRGREVSTKFYTWRLYPEVQTLTLYIPFFHEKGTYFVYPLLTSGTLFTNLVYNFASFNCCKCTVF